MLRNGLPNKAKLIESRNANDFPLPLEPHTKVVAFLLRWISVLVFPNDPKFLKRTVLNVINQDSPYRFLAPCFLILHYPRFPWHQFLC